MSSILAKLNAESDLLVGAGKTLDKRIHHHLVNIADHINGKGNGDTTAANYFFSKLTSSSGIRRDAIGNWLIAFAGCAWNAEAKKFGRQRNFKYDHKAATENPWFKFTKQAEFKPFDLEKALASLIKKAEAALLDDNKDHHHKVPKDLLNKVIALRDAKPLPKASEVTTNEATTDKANAGEVISFPVVDTEEPVTEPVTEVSSEFVPEGWAVAG